MKAFLLLLLSSIAIHSYANYILVNKGGDGGAFITSANPGDTFAFRSSLNPWNYVYVNASGSAAKDIVFINDGGQVQLTSGFQFFSSNYFKLTGTGSTDFYGFHIENSPNSGVAVDVEGKSAFFSIDHIQIANKLYALWIKNEVSCDTTLNYPNHPLHDFEVSFFDVNTVNQDGFYIGSTAPTGGRSVTCNGITYNNRIAGRLYNVYVHDINMNGTGRTGIQLSGCDSGTNRISYCNVKNCGFEFNASQGAGIWLGGMTANCEVDNNTVDSTWLHNYISYGVGTCYFHNNTGDHAGELYGDSAGHVGNHRNNGYSSSLINDPPSVPLTYSTFIWEHNSFGENTDPAQTKVAVLQWNNTYNTNNVICDCGSPIYVTSGITYTSNCNIAGCPGSYDSLANNSFGSAQAIPLNTNIYGTISSSTDKDFYKFTLSSATTLTITLQTLPTDYDLFLYDSSHALLKSSKKAGTTNEKITYTAAAGTYYIKVVAADSTFNSTRCYTLKVSASSGFAAGTKNSVVAKGIIKLFPDPAHSFINIAADKLPISSVIQIVDMNGKVMISKNAMSGFTQIDISKLSIGSYFILINNSNKNRIYKGIFIKE